jgi:hypothetical protein
VDKGLNEGLNQDVTFEPQIELLKSGRVRHVMQFKTNETRFRRDCTGNSHTRG